MLAHELLGFFFPIHYQLGFELEDVLGRGILTRKQVAILWLIRSEGGAQRSVPRKRIEALLGSWFEVTSSAITKAIRGMTQAPLNLVRITEDPSSARERRVELTREGEAFVEAMASDGRRFAARLIRGLKGREIRAGSHFLASIIAALDLVRDDRRKRDATGSTVSRKRGPVNRWSARR